MNPPRCRYLPYGFGSLIVSSWLVRFIAPEHRLHEEQLEKHGRGQPHWNLPFSFDIWHRIDFTHLTESFQRVMLPP